MLVFDPLDPFPTREGATYAEEKQHAEAVDAWLGLEIARTESSLVVPRDGAERWLHVPPSTFLTPYTELRRMLAHLSLSADDTLVDLGAAYGRMGFVMARHSEAYFLGLELVPERVREGGRALAQFGALRARLVQADLADFSLPEANAYFVYDYGTRRAIQKTLSDLQLLARKRSVTVVGRGRAVRDEIERNCPWLSSVVVPIHCGNFSVYRSA